LCEGKGYLRSVEVETASFNRVKELSPWQQIAVST
jgi:hypothetical protein